MSSTVGEMRLFARASCSGIAGTSADALIYQAILWIGGHEGRLYILAAVLSATGGAITNFLLNRYWAFRRTEKHIATQAAQYAVASVLTYVALQASLALLVEVYHVDPRVAYFPAKAFAWLAVSYPLARLVVFGAGGGDRA